MKNTFWASIVILVILIFINGCYTIREHPSLNYNEENGALSRINIKYYNDCSGCHTVNELNETSSARPSNTENNNKPRDSNSGRGNKSRR